MVMGFLNMIIIAIIQGENKVWIYFINVIRIKYSDSMGILMESLETKCYNSLLFYVQMVDETVRIV